MYIKTIDNFVPKTFILNTFYGEETCFCWNEDKLVIFSYKNNDSVFVNTITAPAPIKNIQFFGGRAFLICIPQGIYKLRRNRKFAVLNTSAIEMGTTFYEVLTPKNKYLYLYNKQNLTSKQLFQFSSEESDSHVLCVYPVNSENATEQFIKILTKTDSTVENLCVIAIGKRVLTLLNNIVRIIYNSVYSISDIIPVRTYLKVDALLLVTDADIILMHAKDNELVFENIPLGTNVQTICASFSDFSKDTLLFVYSAESKLYYGQKQLSEDNILQTRVEDKNFLCLQCYDSKTIVGLTTDKQLVEFSMDTVGKMLSTKNDALINLSFDMLKGTDLIMDRIYKGAEELDRLNKVLIIEKDKLKRINLYAHKHKEKFRPKIIVHKTANGSLLSASFGNKLPKDSWIVFNLKSECQNIFCIKKVVDEETLVDISISEGWPANSLQIAIDLITLKDDRYSWCLIRNYVTDPLYEEKKRKMIFINAGFVKARIATLESFLREGNIDMKELSKIRKCVREFTKTPKL